jgi:hypothetical protein
LMTHADMNRKADSSVRIAVRTKRPQKVGSGAD